MGFEQRGVSKSKTELNSGDCRICTNNCGALPIGCVINPIHSEDFTRLLLNIRDTEIKIGVEERYQVIILQQSNSSLSPQDISKINKSNKLIQNYTLHIESLNTQIAQFAECEKFEYNNGQHTPLEEFF